MLPSENVSDGRRTMGSLCKRACCLGCCPEVLDERLLCRLMREESLEDANELAIELESVRAGMEEGGPASFQEGESGIISFESSPSPKSW